MHVVEYLGMLRYSESSLGATLRECRMISGMTLNDVSVQSDIPLTHLLEIETGGCGPTKAMVQNLMAIYAPVIRALHALPEADNRRVNRSTAQIDWIGLLLDSETRTNRELLDDVAAAVRSLRKLPNNAAVHMRKPEADLLVSMLDLREPELPCHIMEAFALSITSTQDFINGAIHRAMRRAKGTDSEFLSRLIDVSHQQMMAA